MDSTFPETTRGLCLADLGRRGRSPGRVALRNVYLDVYSLHGPFKIRRWRMERTSSVNRPGLPWRCPVEPPTKRRGGESPHPLRAQATDSKQILLNVSKDGDVTGSTCNIWTTKINILPTEGVTALPTSYRVWIRRYWTIPGQYVLPRGVRRVRGVGRTSHRAGDLSRAFVGLGRDLCRKSCLLTREVFPWAYTVTQSRTENPCPVLSVEGTTLPESRTPRLTTSPPGGRGGRTLRQRTRQE